MSTFLLSECDNPTSTEVVWKDDDSQLISLARVKHNSFQLSSSEAELDLSPLDLRMLEKALVKAKELGWY